MDAKAGAFAYAQSAKAGAFAYAQSAKAGAFAYAQNAKAGAFAYAPERKGWSLRLHCYLFTQAEGRVLRNVVRINEDAIYRLLLILTRLSSFEVLVGLFRG